MRATTLLTVLALLGTVATPALGQGIVVGGGRAEVRVVARVTMPEIRVLKPVAPPVATWQGGTYTEHQLRVTVAANTHWALVATELPAGVTVLDEQGFFTGERDAVTLRGEKTNATELLIRVRTTAEAGTAWADALRFELRPGR